MFSISPSQIYRDYLAWKLQFPQSAEDLNFILSLVVAGLVLIIAVFFMRRLLNNSGGTETAGVQNSLELIKKNTKR